MAKIFSLRRAFYCGRDRGALYGTTGIKMMFGGDSDISVHGSITATGDGMDLDPNNESILIGASGSVNTDGAGIISNGAGATIFNSGSITARLAGIKIDAVGIGGITPAMKLKMAA